jgi:hypothetical protein
VLLKSLKVSERYVITVLVLRYPDYLSHRAESEGTRIRNNMCLDGFTLFDIADALICNQLGQQRNTTPSQRLSHVRLYPRVFRMLRVMGVEIIWESMIDDSNSDMNLDDDNDNKRYSYNNKCMKDIDGCNCGPDFYRNDQIHITLDHLLAERDGFYQLVLNAHTGIRPSFTYLNDELTSYVTENINYDERIRVCEYPLYNQSKLTGIIYFILNNNYTIILVCQLNSIFRLCSQ